MQKCINEVFCIFLSIFSKINNYFLQLIRLNAKGQLGVGERCVEADGQGVKLAFCRLGTVDGPWQYDEVFKKIISD